nr:hypothetical protein Iba_chr11aCG11940 [Ipomoea batatas]GME02923.1 hypothetical protein Iba_scaffold259CG0460 [Ipomoea batatas]
MNSLVLRHQCPMDKDLNQRGQGREGSLKSEFLQMKSLTHLILKVHKLPKKCQNQMWPPIEIRMLCLLKIIRHFRTKLPSKRTKMLMEMVLQWMLLYLKQSLIMS